ncbi:Hypothetical predicted protein [Podarcis lilfordi]|uniref:Uncharacterized protein n=1 Tax=Podarcis lilfordi TaxID=74358 RepID=A0AA35K6H0_9SAUR|nr:Hypothetical predicted protein [Podarcis lilfordi]
MAGFYSHHPGDRSCRRVYGGRREAFGCRSKPSTSPPPPHDGRREGSSRRRTAEGAVTNSRVYGFDDAVAESELRSERRCVRARSLSGLLLLLRGLRLCVRRSFFCAGPFPRAGVGWA